MKARLAAVAAAAALAQTSGTGVTGDLNGPTPKDAHDATSSGRGVPAPVPHPTPTRASRTRPLAARSPKAIPSAPVNPRGQGDLNWAALRRCESGGNYKTDTGNGYYGAYQFDLRTWRNVGGHGNPAHATPAEQDHRAQMLYAARGRQPWPHCGRYL